MHSRALWLTALLAAVWSDGELGNETGKYATFAVCRLHAVSLTCVQYSRYRIRWAYLLSTICGAIAARHVCKVSYE